MKKKHHLTILYILMISCIVYTANASNTRTNDSDPEYEAEPPTSKHPDPLSILRAIANDKTAIDTTQPKSSNNQKDPVSTNYTYTTTYTTETPKKQPHWKKIESNTKNELNAIFFTDESVGYIAGDYGTILKTTNGGNTWIPLGCGDKAPNLKSIYFTDSQNGLTIGRYGRIFKTTDGGETWIEKQLSYIKPGNSDLTVFSMNFVNSTIGFAVAHEHSYGDYHGCVLKTVDGGETWQEQNFGNIKAELYAVTFVNSQLGFILGGLYYHEGKDWGVLFKTSDGGTTWEKIFIDTSQHLMHVFFVNSQVGYITGMSHAALKTTDGGNTWHSIPIPDMPGGGALYQASWFHTVNNGIVVGYGGSIFKGGAL